MTHPTLFNGVTVTRTGVGLELADGTMVWLSPTVVHSLAAMEGPVIECTVKGVTIHVHAADVAHWAQLMPRLGGGVWD